jgi:hypothetical protein
MPDKRRWLRYSRLDIQLQYRDDKGSAISGHRISPISVKRYRTIM